MSATRNDIGTMNGWVKTPQEYEKHVATCPRGGEQATKLGNCWYEYYCPHCGVVYRIDSSG